MALPFLSSSCLLDSSERIDSLLSLVRSHRETCKHANVGNLYVELGQVFAKVARYFLEADCMVSAWTQRV